MSRVQNILLAQVACCVFRQQVCTVFANHMVAHHDVQVLVQLVAQTSVAEILLLLWIGANVVVLLLSGNLVLDDKVGHGLISIDCDFI